MLKSVAIAFRRRAHFMDTPTLPNLEGQRILILESEIAFGRKLRDALEAEGAETVLVQDPYCEAGSRRFGEYPVCAALINCSHRGVAKALCGPVLVYGVHAALCADTTEIVRALKRLLAEE